ncbi:MAG: glycosyltransferase family 2 protein [Anaerovoracaceae bacterium]
MIGSVPVIIFNNFIIFYTIAILTIFCVTTVSAAVTMSRKAKENSRIANMAEPLGTENIPVSMLVPAYNEGAVINDSIKSLADLDYANYEIIVVNDGSSDNTVEAIIKEFGLIQDIELEKMAAEKANIVEEEIAKRRGESRVDYDVSKLQTKDENTEEEVEIETAVKWLRTQKIRNIYSGTAKVERGDRCTTRPLILIDKENGGKADALNTGINFSKHQLFVAMDADCVIKKDAIKKIVNPFLMSKNTIAAGGNIKISNNLEIVDGEVVKVNPPKGFLAIYQMLEYMRVFFVSRVSWNSINTNVIISGAFGMFKKNKVLEVGGYRTDTVGEDMELVMNLNLTSLAKKEDYKIEYVLDAISYTQVPEDFKDFKNQRIRWHIGLMQSLKNHRSSIFNPKYKRMGMLGSAYYAMFELMSSVIEVVGYMAIGLAVILGLFNFWMFTFLAVTILVYALSVTMSAISIERYIREDKVSFWTSLKLILFSIFEPIVYRQYCNFIRIYAMLRYNKFKNKWNKGKRVEYNS